MKKRMFKLFVAVGNFFGINKIIIKLYKLAYDKTIALSSKDKIFGTFTDSFNQSFELHTEIRDLIKPGWQTMFEPAKNQYTLSNEKIEKKLTDWKNKLTVVENYLAAHSLSLKGQEVMEIGSFDGATAFALAEFGAKKVLGTDIGAYYIIKTPGNPITDDDINIQNAKLAAYRNVYAKKIDAKTASNVSFIEDNICTSSIASESIDVVLSWEVLEHIIDPENAFKEMNRILKPGGFAFHEYNPFFSIYGGHSLCTLDFFWGHAILNDQDFEKYVTEIRPNEKEAALNFFHNALNRMTLSQLKHHTENAGLTIVNLMPLIEKENLQHLSHEAIKQIKNLYPTLTLDDLIAPFVWVIFQKKL